MGLRVLLVDDDALVRAGLRMILSSADDIDVVGEADDGARVPAAVAALRPDVILMDIRMPGTDGIAATKLVRERAEPPHVIVLTTFGADEYVLQALRAGAAGFLLKDTPPDKIIEAVRVVHAGDGMLSPGVTRVLLEHIASDSRDGDRRGSALRRLEQLTGREREVARAVGDGASNAEIAESLYMSEATVKAHVSRTLAKVGAGNRVQLAILVHDAEHG